MSPNILKSFLSGINPEKHCTHHLSNFPCPLAPLIVTCRYLCLMSWFKFLYIDSLYSIPIYQQQQKIHISGTFKIYKVIFICSRHPNTHSDEPKHSCHTHLHLSTDDMLYPLMCSHSVPLFFL